MLPKLSPTAMLAAKQRPGSVPHGARRDRKLEEILAEVVAEPRFHFIIKEHATELLACAEHLTTTVPAPTWIVGCQVKQLQCTAQRMLEAIVLPPRMRAEGALNLTAHVA